MIFSGSNGPPSTNHVTCNVREETIQKRTKSVREEIQEERTKDSGRTNHNQAALYTERQTIETERTRYERGIMAWRPLEML